MEKGHKRVRDHLADIHLAQLKIRDAQHQLQEAEVELVKTLIDKHDPYLLKPHYGRLTYLIKNNPEF